MLNNADYLSIQSIDCNSSMVSHIQIMSRKLRTIFTYEWAFDWINWYDLLNVNKLYLRFENIKKCEVCIQSVGDNGTNREASFSIPDSDNVTLELPSDLLSGNLNVVLTSNSSQDFLSGNWFIKKSSISRDITVSSVLYTGNNSFSKNILWNIKQLSNISNNLFVYSPEADLDMEGDISENSNIYFIRSEKNGKRNCFQESLLKIWNLDPKPDYIFFSDSSQCIQENIMYKIVGLLSNLKKDKESCSFENKSEHSWFQLFPLIPDISENLPLPMPIMQSNSRHISLIKKTNNEKKGKLNELCYSC